MAKKRLTYQIKNLVIKRGDKGPKVKDLQRNLRSLGYRRTGIDGAFGPKTKTAVRALQHDLMHNVGTGSEESVRIIDYNKSRVEEEDGVVTQDVVGCIDDMLVDPKFCKVPAADNPKAENARRYCQLQGYSVRLMG